MMRLSQLYKMSDAYLAKIIDRTEFQTTPQAFEALMGINRAVRLIKEHLNNAFLAKKEGDFYKCIELLEDDSDEAIHFLDNLRRHDRRTYSEIINEGEELLSHYVIAYNLLIEKNIKKRHRDTL